MGSKAILTACFLLSTCLAGIAEMPASYPKSCAQIDFCGPVSKMDWISVAIEGYPELRVVAAFGEAAVRSSIQITRSADKQSHVCMRYDPFGNLEVTCLMVPMPTLQASASIRD